MKTILDFIQEFTLPHENSYGKDEDGNRIVVAEHVQGDPGGTTKYGIDAASHPNIDIEGLTQDDAEQIYLKEYSEVHWFIPHDLYSALSEFPQPANLAFFDCREVCGTRAAWLCVQRALALNDDGVPGSITRSAIMQSPGFTLAISSIDERIIYHRRVAASNPSLAKFLEGWINRCNDLKEFLSPPEQA